MITPRHSLFALTLLAVLVAVPAAAVDPIATRGPGGSNPLVIPAGAFGSDGDEAFEYWIAGEYISGGTGVRLRAPVYLPPHAYVTDFMVVAHDNNGSLDAYFYLHETPFGTIGDDVIISTVHTTGSDTGMQYPADYNVDRSFDPANNLYWVEASLGADDLRLYSIHILYEDDIMFSDGFECANTERWSTVTAKSAADQGDRPELTPAQETSDDVAVALPELLKIVDPEAREALEAAMNDKRYGSPVVIPGAAFKTTGHLDFDTYYISSLYGFVYARPDVDSVLVAPVNVPDGAHISFLMFFFKDSNPSLDIRFWLSRMNTWDGSGEDLLYETSSGADPAVRSLTFTASDLTDPDVDYSHYSYWLTVDVEGYDFSEDYWHEFYAAVILYILPTE